jgi:hypothetical protein
MNDLEHGRAILETARLDARALRGIFDALLLRVTAVLST